MRQGREFYAATVEEAVEKASQSLNVDPGNLSYEVLDPGSAGFIGIGARDARIVVDAPGLEAEAPVESAEAQPEASPVAAPQQENRAERNGPDDGLEDEPPGPPADEVPVPEEVLEYIRGFMASAVEGIGLDARIDVYDAGEFIAVDVASGQAGLFIGQKGETIDALQYLVNVATYKNRTFVKRIVLDSEGYRQRRVEAIQGMAHRSARRAVRERRTIELPPMNPAERRIVHLYLKDNVQVSTASEGTGQERRVRVSPS
jgi:spoIIIJ-associated protein